MLLSLCIPTNGMVKWVLPVLDSIYGQCVDINLFEVVISDNGNNSEMETAIRSYLNKYHNLVYHKSSAAGFHNQIESCKLARGEFIKVINHRTVLCEGALNHILDGIKNNSFDKPIIFFLNGVENRKTFCVYDNFSDFMRNLGIYSSWSGGIAFWRKDFQAMINSDIVYTEDFPIMDCLCYYRTSKKYIIDNTLLVKEITSDATEKGKYNLFKAFAVEYIEFIQNLRDMGDISSEAYKSIYDETNSFLIELYFRYVLSNQSCSYILDNYKGYISRYFNLNEIHNIASARLIQQSNTRHVVDVIDRLRYIKVLSASKDLYVYGAGKGGSKVADFFDEFGIRYKGFIDKRAKSICNYCEHGVYELDELKSLSEVYIVISLMAGGDVVKRELLVYGLDEENVIEFWQ